MPESPGAARLNRLSADIGQLQLARFFSPNAMQTLAQQPEIRQLIQQLGQFLLSSNNLQGTDIKASRTEWSVFRIHGSLWPSRCGGQYEVGNDRAAAIIARAGSDTTRLNGAIDEIEARQIETLGHQLQRQTQLSWLLPFNDQPPVFLQIAATRR